MKPGEAQAGSAPQPEPLTISLPEETDRQWLFPAYQNGGAAMSDARTEDRLGRLEADVGEIKTTLASLVPLILRIEATLTATLPHLATKAELTTGLSEVRGEIADVKVALADKPGKVFLTAAIAILIAAYGLGLAGLAALPVATKLIH
jgi:hypothetical protein